MVKRWSYKTLLIKGPEVPGSLFLNPYSDMITAVYRIHNTVESLFAYSGSLIYLQRFALKGFSSPLSGIGGKAWMMVSAVRQYYSG